MINKQTNIQKINIKKIQIEVFVEDKKYIIEHTGSWKIDENQLPFVLKKGLSPEKNFINSMNYNSIFTPLNDDTIKINLKNIQAYKIIKEEDLIVEYRQDWSDTKLNNFLFKIGFWPLKNSFDCATSFK